MVCFIYLIVIFKYSSSYHQIHRQMSFKFNILLLINIFISFKSTFQFVLFFKIYKFIVLFFLLTHFNY